MSDSVLNNSNAVLTAEERLLNAIWLDPNLLDDPNYSEDLFVHDVCRSIAKSIDLMTKNGTPLTNLALYNESAKIDMSVDQKIIDGIINMNDQPVEYIKDITDFLKSINKSISSLNHIKKIEEVLTSNVTLSPDIIQNLRDEFEEAENAVLLKDGSITKVMNMEEWGEQWEDEYKDRKNGKKYFFNEPTFDNLIVDGPIPGAGTLLVAGSGMGKSTAVLKLTNNLINAGVPTMLWTLEMGSVSTYDRLLSTRLQIPYKEIVNPSDEETFNSIYQMWKTEKERLEQNKNFRICENADVSLYDMKKEIIKFQKQIGQNYCIVIIDLITMIKDFCNTKNGLSLAGTIEIAMNKINAMAKELGIHYVGTAQLNRSGETSSITDVDDIDRFRPTRAQIKNSAALLERTRATVSLFRKKYFADMYLPDDPETESMQDVVEFQLLKQNNGECVRLYELFEGETFSMTPIDNPNEEDFEEDE